MASSSHRNLFKGWSDGMSTLANGVVGESKDREEVLLVETQYEIKKLIEQLESRDEKSKT